MSPGLVFVIAAGCATVPAPDAGTGTLWGFVNLQPRKGVHPGSQDGTAYGDRRLRDVEFVNYRNPDYAVVYVDGPSHGRETAAVTLGSTAAGPRFDSTYVAIGVGGDLAVRNADDHAHVFSCPSAGFLKRLDAGESTTLQVHAQGEMEVFVLDARAASATIFAVRGPYTVVSKNGRWALPGLAPGERDLHAWHPRFPVLSREVQVTENEATRVDLDIGVGTLEVDNIVEGMQKR
jgi:hypothetical protein